MALEFISCPACGTKNGSERTVCLGCEAKLVASEESPRTETEFTSEPAAEPLLERVGRYVKNLTIEQAMKLAILLSVSLVAFSVFYYLVIFLPHKEEALLKLQKEEQAAKQFKDIQRSLEKESERSDREAKEASNSLLLYKCLTATDKDNDANWAAACRGLGRDSNCRLPLQLANSVDARHKESSNQCYKQFPQR